MFKLFKKFDLADWIWIFVMMGLIVLTVYFDVTLPEYSGKITQAARAGLLEPGWIVPPNPMLPAGMWSEGVWINAGIMLLFALGSIGCSVIVGYIAARMSARLGKKIRNDVFNQVQAFSFEETNKFSTPSLITRTTNDVQQVQMAVFMIMRMAISAPITMVWAIVKLNSSSTDYTIATGIWMGLMIAVIAILIIIAFPKFKTMQKLTDKLNGATRENLSGLRVVKAYNADGYQEEKFEKANENITKTNRFVNRIMGVFFPFVFLVLNGTILTIYWLGAYLINGLVIGPDVMIGFTMLVSQVLMSVMMLIIFFIMVPRAQVAANRINEVLDTKLSIADPEKGVSEGTASPKYTWDNAVRGGKLGQIEFRSVSFKYPGAENCVLEDISFTAEKGETIAFIGSTGSGKSTLINLVPRFYDVTEGEVLINGVNIKNIAQESLRQRIGYVPQKGLLFSGSVEENIGYGRDNITESEIRQSAEIACASEFIEKMENGYKADIAQGGKNVSGGQKQRLSIARAVATVPDIFIFDDSFSALDYKTDKQVRANLKEKTKDATCMIVAQRIGTIMDADKIVVLDSGKIVGLGKHRELLDSCEVYREIALSQLNKEELGI